MKTITKTRAVGGSLVVTIPIEIVKSEMLRENEVVEIEVSKPKKDFFGVLKGVGKFSRTNRIEDRF
jgi:hypothetical protein